MSPSAISTPSCGSTRKQIVELQRQLGTTTLYVTHDQVEAMTMGHRIAVLNQGRLQQLGTPWSFTDGLPIIVAQFIGSPPMNVLPCRWGQAGRDARRATTQCGRP